MARPSFKLDTSRLRSFREESLLTQREVAEKANIILKKFDQIAGGEKFKIDEDKLDSYARSYQRTEQKGSATKAMAAALAQVFETTVEILQGGAPEAKDSSSVVARIEQQLREQEMLGSNLALQRALTQHEYMDDFAEDIGVAIETAQISQNSSEIARLAELTGWSEAELQQLGSVHGRWLLLTAINGSSGMEIVLGIDAVLSKIRETLKEWITGQCSDACITINRPIPWYHVDIDNPRVPMRGLKFSFVRCEPETSCLKWVKPTWLDQFWLEEPLKELAFSKVNFFTDFNGNKSPNDVRRLRFRVQERDADGVAQRVAYSKGDLEGLPEENFQEFKANGAGHSLVIIWLNIDGLAKSLAPHLTIYPSECWSVSAGACYVAISLNMSPGLLRTNKELGFCRGINYTIDLVEEISPGVYESVPWRDDDVTEVCSRLEKRLFEKLDGIAHGDALQFFSP